MSRRRKQENYAKNPAALSPVYLLSPSRPVKKHLVLERAQVSILWKGLKWFYYLTVWTIYFRIFDSTGAIFPSLQWNSTDVYMEEDNPSKDGLTSFATAPTVNPVLRQLDSAWHALLLKVLSLSPHYDIASRICSLFRHPRHVLTVKHNYLIFKMVVYPIILCICGCWGCLWPTLPWKICTIT